jgi:hypothetical protein
LVRFASAQFVLNELQEDGCTLRDHLLSGYKQTGVKSPELEVENPPDEAEYVWGYFLSLAARRRFSEHGPERISWIDIQAWLNVTRTKIEPWELNAILAIDNAYFENRK